MSPYAAAGADPASVSALAATLRQQEQGLRSALAGAAPVSGEALARLDAVVTALGLLAEATQRHAVVLADVGALGADPTEQQLAQARLRADVVRLGRTLARVRESLADVSG